MLVVDDEENVALTLAMIFRQEGFRVTTAGSCAEALELLKQQQFDVVLTDLHMEKPDVGLDVARAAHRKQPRPVIVVLTGYASMSNAHEALRVPVDHYAFKPAEISELLESVRRLVGWRSDRVAGD